MNPRCTTKYIFPRISIRNLGLPQTLQLPLQKWQILQMTEVHMPMADLQRPALPAILRGAPSMSANGLVIRSVATDPVPIRDYRSNWWGWQSTWVI